ncbi:MAG: ABC transporter permease [Lachnospiraceae bacterium]|nr:ABC transporter permease [Lachnospiraceae bacterium]MBQ8633728.1 ABC transporter permease [Lachnospiraceae bacterium]
MKNFKGWRNVFSFNYKQNAGSKSYIAVTALVAILLMAGAILISIIAAKPDKDDEKKEAEYCAVETAYVLDLAELGELKFKEWIPALSEEYYSKLSLVQVNNLTEEELKVKAAKEESGLAIGVVIKQEENVISVAALVPSTSEELYKSDGKEIADLVAVAVEQARFEKSGLSELQLSMINKQAAIVVADAGEETNVVVYMVKYFAPAIFGLVLYFLLLLYGQSINQSVSVEKTSKLVETLLTSLHPYALLTGKVFAIVATAMQQFFIWVAALIVGIVAGGMISESMYPGTESGLSVAVEFMRANIGESAFSPVAVVLALITFCFGFLFYCVLSGMAGSMVSRPEEAANTQSIFTLPIVISWIVCYFGTLMEKESLLVVARNIPFTIPFCVPVDLLTGAIGIGQGLLSMAILIVFSLLIIMLSGRIYKGLVLYTGEKVTLKNLIGILKNKN